MFNRKSIFPFSLLAILILFTWFACQKLDKQAAGKDSAGSVAPRDIDTCIQVDTHALSLAYGPSSNYYNAAPIVYWDGFNHYGFPDWGWGQLNKFANGCPVTCYTAHPPTWTYLGTVFEWCEDMGGNPLITVATQNLWIRTWRAYANTHLTDPNCVEGGVTIPGETQLFFVQNYTLSECTIDHPVNASIEVWGRKICCDLGSGGGGESLQTGGQ